MTTVSWLSGKVFDERHKSHISNINKNVSRNRVFICLDEPLIIKMSYSAYTDGACINNPGNGGFGSVILSGDKVIQELSGFMPNTTNNKAEMTAVIETLKWLKEPSDITIYTDSQYVSNGMTKWLDGWKKNNWKKADRKPVLNTDLWKELDELCGKHRVTFVWIARSSHPYNKTADRLANGRARLGE
ncbi:ribonuclease H [Brazilian marseillevirus]|uniref:Rnase H n=1 Tax=Brazilian marseillevirus TaxID=1813599 RepID=UPI0007804A56|nr:Rnase H [Brazilian marseillevirus]AMQ10643.1 ribonuclease H [Brazilian marseillevirus]